jgi:proliferating cell nuclear antigen PCNA
MNIEINNPVKCDIFVSLFQHFSKFVEHTNIQFENERMFIQSMNSSHVVIFEIILPKEWFDVYNVTSGSIRIGVMTGLFYKVLKKREKSQKITIENKTKDTLYFHFSGEDKTVFNKEFEMPLMEIDSELLDIPHINHQAEFSLSTENFSNLVNQFKDFGDTIDIDCSEDNIQLSSQSSESGKMMAKINIEDLTEFSIDEDETIHTSFGLRYLHDICAYQKLSKQVEIKISSNFPMMIIYRLNDDTSPLSTFSPEIDDEVPTNAPRMVFYLAPKINDDE